MPAALAPVETRGSWDAQFIITLLVFLFRKNTSVLRLLDSTDAT